MKLNIEGNIGGYYVQTLCLIFFPGAKFSETKQQDSGDSASVRLENREDGFYAEAVLSSGELRGEGSAFLPRNEVDSEDRLAKRAVGKAVFEAGAACFGFRPEWGFLTGVRPAKLAAELIAQSRERGDSYPVDTVRQILSEGYLTSRAKAELLTSVAENEKRLLAALPGGDCSIYISVPFCPTRCAYCSFVSFSNEKLLSLIPEYTERLCEDIRHIGEMVRRLGLRVSTVYIGGGTPTVLEAPLLHRVLEAVARSVELSSVREFTVEAGRPDTITRDKLQELKYGGVTRISINPQTLSDGVLKEIGRSHTAEDFFRAYELAAETGFSCINTDLIAGLPGDNEESFRRSLDGVLELSPENLTVHTFCVKKASALWERDSVYSRTGGDTGASVAYSQLRAAEEGYMPYYMYKQKNAVGNFENVGFSKPGKEGLYNILIMEEVHSIFAVGAGAVTKLVSGDGKRIKRIFMPKYPYEYLSGDQGEKRSQYLREVEEFYKTVY